jgi:spore germination protein GerM
MELRMLVGKGQRAGRAKIQESRICERPDSGFASCVLCLESCVLCLVSCVLTAASFAGANVLVGQTPVSTAPAHSTEVTLYFLHTEELKLATEKRAISQAANTVEQIKLTVAELIKGPTTMLERTIPEETQVREVFLDEKGCAYVDFSRDISQKHPGGTTGELITISSIVNTLTTNFPEEIRKVRILIGGREAETIAGHIDISRPIFPFEL